MEKRTLIQMTSNPKSRQNDLVIQELSDEVLIYDLRTHKAFCLNQTAAFVWQHADGTTPVKQIAYLLQRKLKTPVDESVVWFALEQLGKDGLLENKPPAPVTFAGMNRRDLIKTLGKSAAVALPLIMAITAPTVAQAQSGGAAVACATDGQICGCFGCLLCCQNLSCIADAIGEPLTCTRTGGGCVLWNTEITTADGLSVRARDVVVGQSLLGVNCLNGETIAGRVKHVMEKETSGVYSIFAENGAVVNCSPSHLLINGFGDSHGRRAELFKEGDPLLVLDAQSRKIVEAKTTAINYVEIYQPVLMFEMDTAEHTFTTDGIISHNKLIGE